MLRLCLIVSALLVLLSLTGVADESGRIYGKITTVDGDEFQGLIRWDKNEGNWVDILDGTKRIDEQEKTSGRRQYRDRETSVKVFGLKIGKANWDDDSNWASQSGIRFGHIKSIEVMGSDEIRVSLKSGKEVELSEGSTDIGENIREIIIEDDEAGEIEFVWDDLERIDFMQAPGGTQSRLGSHLYGTLTTRRGDEFSGYIGWDVDEIFTSDILDGEEEGRSRKIKFELIESIARYSSSGATVKLKNGDEVLLRGTNDVNDENSGIMVCDPNLGQITVQWDDLDKVVFSQPARHVMYDQFDGGRNISGTIFTEDGGSYTGTILWDADEEDTWEMLNGENRNIDFDIEFGMIASIEKGSRRSAIVKLRDGREFRLEGSNDVDEDNKGIYITLSDGKEVEVDWDEFERVEFSK